MISPRLAAGLRHLAEFMRAESEPWWIIGSTAMVLSGIDGVEPDDIDVVASGACLRRVLASAGIPEAAPKPHPQFRSSPYQRIETDAATPIELMGDLHLQKASKFMRIVFDSRIEVKVGGSTVFTPSIPEQIALFHQFGRDKDLAKAALLENFVGH